MQAKSATSKVHGLKWRGRKVSFCTTVTVTYYFAGSNVGKRKNLARYVLLLESFLSQSITQSANRGFSNGNRENFCKILTSIFLQNHMELEYFTVFYMKPVEYLQFCIRYRDSLHICRDF
ncbi:hypothetical protein HOLleu_18988 [Holothuria leucospilota]|uniref:Uncharacterized protein n=1 Tax=Holothuria leucospilota TaxID=206669 RepID=A0A9Q1HA29_HOLLE|nr:hypothetical protein HOLleu_18988 [Holothuria leucospilota]